ncbi:MAG TPA: YncE family protein [Terriglobales bacterium]|nr:YncE family protein [Terriglobales bacterium]
MSLLSKGGLPGLMLLFLICISCGDVYRPTIIPQPVPTPDPKNSHSTFTVNQNGTATSGTGMQVDVSGDSAAGVTKVAIMPVHAVILGNRVWVANQGADSVSAFSVAGGTTPIGTSVDINLAGGAAPDYVESSEATTMYVANSGNGTVNAINTITNAITNTITVGAHPIAMVETPSNASTISLPKKLYVVNRDSGDVTVIASADKTVVATLTVGASPRWAAIRSDGARVYILSHDTGIVSIINTLLPTDAVIGSTVVGPGAEFLYYDSRRNRLYIPNPVTGRVRILDASSDSLPLLATIDLTAAPSGGGAAPCPATGCSAVSVAALPDGTRAYIASYYLDTTSASCQQTACVQAQVTVIDANTNQVTKAIPLPEVSVSPVANCAAARFRISAATAIDSSRIYVSSCDAGAVWTVNTSGDIFFATVPAPGSAYSATLMKITDAVQNGTDTTYSFTYDPNSGTPAFLGMVVTITNMSIAVDNGTFVVTGLGNGTFTVSNPSGQSTTGESATGLGEPPRQNPVFMLTGF